MIFFLLLACSLIDIKQIIVPLVDNGSIENDEQENELLYFLHENSNFLKLKMFKFFSSLIILLIN